MMFQRKNYVLKNKTLLGKKFSFYSTFSLTYFVFFFRFKDSRVNFFDQPVPLSQGLSQLL